LLGTFIGGEPVTVSTRAVSMWLQLELPRMGSVRRPFRNLIRLDLSSSSCDFVVLSATLWGCHLPKSTNQPWTVSMRG